MKVIDLLNKIANGETLPGKIKYNRTIYHYGKYIEWYITDDLLEELFIDKNKLNDEIEIIEDIPKVQVEMTQEEYMEYLDRKLDTPKEDNKIKKLNEHIFVDDHSLVLKINEIIDRLNGE